MVYYEMYSIVGNETRTCTGKRTQQDASGQAVTISISMIASPLLVCYSSNAMCVLDAEVIQLTDYSTHIPFIVSWQLAGQHKEHYPVYRVTHGHGRNKHTVARTQYTWCTSAAPHLRGDTVVTEAQ